MPRNYVNNSYNRSLGRVGMPVGSMVVSSGGSRSSGGGGSSYSGSSSRTYVDNSYNRSVGRVGMPLGSMVMSRNSSSASSGATSYASSGSDRTYVDNSYNRAAGRVGMPVGSMVISKDSSTGYSSQSTATNRSGSSATGSSKTYVDNAYNRRHERVGMPHGTAVVSQSKTLSVSSSRGYSAEGARPKVYKDNAMNRHLGRVGKPIGSVVYHKATGTVTENFVGTERTEPKRYVDNAYNRRHDRVGLEHGDAVIPKNKPSNNLESNVRVYMDNALNRRLDRVGKPLGTAVYNKETGTVSVQNYKDNAVNRRLDRVDKPKGCLPNMKKSELTQKIADSYKLLQATDEDEYFQPEMRPLYEEFDEEACGYDDWQALERAKYHLNRKMEEMEWLECNMTEPLKTQTSAIEDYTGNVIPFEELQLGRKIGEGGFGEVYFAKWHGTVVAVKKLRPGKFSKKREKQFSEEVLNFCQLEHPNVVKFLGVCLEKLNSCIVMEYMQTSLFNALHVDEEDLSDETRLDIIRGMCAGLDYLHSEKIAHCDLKSENILLDKRDMGSYVAKITDFGLSMVKTYSQTSSANEVERVKNVGTPRYSSPEVIRGEMLSAADMMRADIYSMALVIYEVIYEEEPFYNLSYAQLQTQIGKNGRLPDLDDDNVRHMVKKTVQDALSFQAEDRLTSNELMDFFYNLDNIYRTTNSLTSSAP